MTAIENGCREISTGLFAHVFDHFKKSVAITPERQGFAFTLKGKAIAKILSFCLHVTDNAVARTLAQNFYSQDHTIHVRNQTINKAQKNALIVNVFEEFSQYIAQSIIGEQIPISADGAASSWGYRSEDLEEFSCYQYALAKIGEERAFTDEFLDSFSDEQKLPKTLFEWGYVCTADPRPGDLALFFAGDQLMHLGVCRGDGVVESKWGNEARTAYLHKVENAPESYGDRILYLRPPANTQTRV